MMNDERDPRDEAADPTAERPSDEPTQEPIAPQAAEPPAAPPDVVTPDATVMADATEPSDAGAGEFESAPAAADQQAGGWPAADHAEASPSMADTPDPEPVSDVSDAADATDAVQSADSAPVADSSFPSQRFPSEPWPTEPPAAGSADADTWPTRAPERHDEPASEPAPHPPSEAEAYAPPPEPSHDAAVDDTAAMVAASGTTPAHSVPAASEMGESTQCPRCGTENRPGLAFCRNCGQRLVAAGMAPTVERLGAPEGTLACPRCGTHNRAGVAFCQNCGANLRAAATPGYVPPAAEATPQVTAEAAPAAAEGGAILGPVVLIIGALGIIAGWLLPFAYAGTSLGTSLYQRAFGAGGYGAAFWTGYKDVPAGITDQAYFGFAGPSPLLVALLVVLAIGGFVRARPGALQSIGLAIALIWAIGLAALFVVIEVLGNAGGPITELLRALTPGGIIFFLASLIVLIGTLTRFARS